MKKRNVCVCVCVCVLLLTYKIKEHNQGVYHLRGSMLTVNFTASGLTQETGRWVYLCRKTLPLGVEPSPGLESWMELKGKSKPSRSTHCFLLLSSEWDGSSCFRFLPP